MQSTSRPAICSSRASISSRVSVVYGSDRASTILFRRGSALTLFLALPSVALLSTSSFHRRRSVPHLWRRKAGNTHTIELGVGIRLFRKRSGRSTSAWPTSAMPNFAADLDEALIIGLHLGGVSAIPKAVGNEKTRLSRLRTRN